MTMNSGAAALFHQLHHGEQPLILANAWDAGSARMVENLGAKAVATTSAGVAWTHGYSDGHALSTRLLVETVTQIARAVRTPVTVDIVGGFSDDPAKVAQLIEAIIDAGAVGINVEDGLSPPDLLCAKIERAREAGIRLGVDLFINARTDVYIRKLAPAGAEVVEVLARARRYREAGASGLFAIGVVDADDIGAIVAESGLPLNVLAWPGLPSLEELTRLGVRRVSAGSGIAEALWGQAVALTNSFLDAGCWPQNLAGNAMAYGAVNALFPSPNTDSE